MDINIASAGNNQKATPPAGFDFSLAKRFLRLGCRDIDELAAVVDQANNSLLTAPTGTQQGVGFVMLLNQPRLRASA